MNAKTQRRQERQGKKEEETGSSTVFPLPSYLGGLGVLAFIPFFC
jgi:hypothetical protein